VIVCADGNTVRPGDRAFNYYDRRWVTVGSDIDADGWVTCTADDGRTNTLNGERLSTSDPYGTTVDTHTADAADQDTPGRTTAGRQRRRTRTAGRHAAHGDHTRPAGRHGRHRPPGSGRRETSGQGWHRPARDTRDRLRAVPTASGQRRRDPRVARTGQRQRPCHARRRFRERRTGRRPVTDEQAPRDTVRAHNADRPFPVPQGRNRGCPVPGRRRRRRGAGRRPMGHR
jgi:hypothetical protein